MLQVMNLKICMLILVLFSVGTMSASAQIADQTLAGRVVPDKQLMLNRQRELLASEETVPYNQDAVTYFTKRKDREQIKTEIVAYLDTVESIVNRYEARLSEFIGVDSFYWIGHITPVFEELHALLQQWETRDRVAIEQMIGQALHANRSAMMATVLDGIMVETLVAWPELILDRLKSRQGLDNTFFSEILLVQRDLLIKIKDQTRVVRKIVEQNLLFEMNYKYRGATELRELIASSTTLMRSGVQQLQSA